MYRLAGPFTTTGAGGFGPHCFNSTLLFPMRTHIAASSRCSTRTDEPRNPGLTATAGICHRFPSHATV